MTGIELDRVIVAWLEAYYPELAQEYRTWSLVIAGSPELDHALDIFMEALGQHYPGVYYFQVPYEEACRKLHLETNLIPIAFYNAFGKETPWKN